MITHPVHLPETVAAQKRLQDSQHPTADPLLSPNFWAAGGVGAAARVHLCVMTDACVFL